MCDRESAILFSPPISNFRKFLPILLEAPLSILRPSSRSHLLQPDQASVLAAPLLAPCLSLQGKLLAINFTQTFACLLVIRHPPHLGRVA